MRAEKIIKNSENEFFDYMYEHYNDNDVNGVMEFENEIEKYRREYLQSLNFFGSAQRVPNGIRFSFDPLIEERFKGKCINDRRFPSLVRAYIERFFIISNDGIIQNIKPFEYRVAETIIFKALKNGNLTIKRDSYPDEISLDQDKIDFDALVAYIFQIISDNSIKNVAAYILPDAVIVKKKELVRSRE